MSRELPTSALSDEDYAYWEARLPSLQLANLVDVYGREGSGSARDAKKAAAKAEKDAAEAQAKADADKAAADAAEAEAAALAAVEADAAQAAANAGDGDDEDLIGAPTPVYDPLTHKVSEVQAHIDANPDEADAVRAAEAARTDREPRTSITGYKV